MPISIQNDVKSDQGFTGNFKVSDFEDFTSGSLLDYLRPRIADQKWDEFNDSWNTGSVAAFTLETQRNLIRALALKFNLDSSEIPAFDLLFPIAFRAQQFAKDNKNGIIKSAVENGYDILAQIAAGMSSEELTFSRIVDRDDSQFVIFSDHHMTAFDRMPNYFHEFNYALYLDVLNHYSNTEYCLVENGDVEECIIWEPNVTEAMEYVTRIPTEIGFLDPGIPALLPDFPIDPTDSRWTGFLNKRYTIREENLRNIYAKYADYYSMIRNNFVPRNKFVRLTGNHDTYMGDSFERTLRDLTEAELGASINDVLRIRRGGIPSHVVLHGHQFDSVCVMHSHSVPLAKTMGESFSEFLSWAFQGPDRVWTTTDTKTWTLGRKPINNYLAVEEPRSYSLPDVALLLGLKSDIKANPRGFVESLLGHEIAWEYFENRDGFEAFTLEVWTGEEMYKMRHMNEIELCQQYRQRFNFHRPQTVPPKFVLGHTHEPRKRAQDKDNPASNAGLPYLNSGSAGRHENLIWCVEIDGMDERIVSWSRQEGQLQKIVWEPEGDQLVPGVTTFH